MISFKINHGVLFVLVVASLSCTQNDNPASPVTEPQPEQVLRGKQRLHGYWKVVNNQWDTKYLVADTLISRLVMKLELGSNFRRSIDELAVFTDSTIFLGNNVEPWTYYRFSADSDTLFMSFDSLYKYPLIAVTDSMPGASEQWVPTLKYDLKSHMRLFTYGWLSGAHYSADQWYFFFPGNQSSVLEVRNSIGDTLRTIILSKATTCGVAGGFLWIGGNYYVDQRSLEDTTLIQRIDLSSHYSFASSDYVFAMTVHNSLIYIVVEDHLLCFNMSGQLVNDVPIIDEIMFITFVGESFIVGTTYSTINTVDPNTGSAIESYLFPEEVYGNVIVPLGGIVNLGDRLVGFRSTDSEILRYEFTYPQ